VSPVFEPLLLIANAIVWHQSAINLAKLLT
jgi:hypothetical protein